MISVRLAEDSECDVAVIGGGPAGAATAAHLAGRGIDVTVIDHKPFPRDKVCGDFVGPVALVELERLGTTGAGGYRTSNIVREAALYLDGKPLIVRSIPEVPGLPPHGRVVRRMQLDAWIMETARSAGASVLERHRVAGFERDRRGVVLTVAGPGGRSSSLRARAVVGADGSNSQMARVLRRESLRKDKRIIAVRGYYRGIRGPADRADLYFSARSFPGYYWLFPTGPGEANVGVGMVLRTVPPTDEHLRELLLALVRDDPSLRDRIGDGELEGKILGWPLTTYDPGLAITADRMLLVGDAAGLINPLNGEGIQYALLSARWAAEVLEEGLAHDRLSRRALRPYPATVERHLRYDMALAQMIVQLIRNRSLNAVWLRALRILVGRSKVDPDFAYTAGGILSGLLPASDAVSRRMLLGALEQAAMSLGIDAGVAVFRARKTPPALGLPVLRTGYQVAYDTALAPRETLEWAGSLPGTALELASQVARGTLAGKPPAQISRSTM